MRGNPMGGGMGGGIGGGLTDTGKKLGIALIALFALELFLVHWLKLGFVMDLFLYPIGDPNFGPWQVLTHPLVQEPNGVIAFLLQLLALYFFGAPVEAALGRKGFLTLFFGVVIVSSVPGLLVSSLLLSDLPRAVPYGGLEASSFALVTAFALLHREAKIHLFFVLPVKALWLLYGTLAYLGLLTLARMEPHGFYYLSAIGASYLYIKFGGRGSLRKAKLRYEEWKLKRRLSKLRVVPGGKSDRGDDEPMYH